MADAETRRQLELSDDWQLGLSFDNENRAHGEFAWLRSHNEIREYLLVRRVPKDTPYVDDLDDEVPF